MRGHSPPRKFQGLLKRVSLKREARRIRLCGFVSRTLRPPLPAPPPAQASRRVWLSFSGHTCCSCHLLASGRASGQRLVVGQGPSLPAGHTAPSGELGLHPASTLGSPRSACFRTSKTRCEQFSPLCEVRIQGGSGEGAQTRELGLGPVRGGGGGLPHSASLFSGPAERSRMQPIPDSAHVAKSREHPLLQLRARVQASPGLLTLRLQRPPRPFLGFI